MGTIHITSIRDNCTIVCPSSTPEVQSFFSVHFGADPRFHPFVAYFLILDMMDALNDLFNNRLSEESVKKLRDFSERLLERGGVSEKDKDAFHASFTLRDVSTKGKLWLYKYTSYNHTSSYDDGNTFQPYCDMLVALYYLYSGLSYYFDKYGRDVDTYFYITIEENSQQ